MYYQKNPRNEDSGDVKKTRTLHRDITVQLLRANFIRKVFGLKNFSTQMTRFSIYFHCHPRLTTKNLIKLRLITV